MQLKKTCMTLLTFATWVCHPVQAMNQDAVPNDVRSTDDRMSNTVKLVDGNTDESSNLSATENTSESTITEQEAKYFIEDTAQDIIKILANKQATLSMRKKSFNRLLVKKFNIKAIGKFVLGRYWRQLNEKQVAEYLDLFQSSLVDSYATQFNKYSDPKFEVKSSFAIEKGGRQVVSEVQLAHRAPVIVQWQLFKKPKTGIRIYNIKIEDVSMIVTRRNEYASLIQSTGKGVNGLLRYMRSDHLQHMRSDYSETDSAQVKSKSKPSVSDSDRMIDSDRIENNRESAAPAS